MMEVFLWALMFFGSAFAGGFLGVVVGVAVMRVQRRKHTPTWAHQDWRGL